MNRTSIYVRFIPQAFNMNHLQIYFHRHLPTSLGPSSPSHPPSKNIIGKQGPSPSSIPGQCLTVMDLNMSSPDHRAHRRCWPNWTPKCVSFGDFKNQKNMACPTKIMLPKIHLVQYLIHVHETVCPWQKTYRLSSVKSQGAYQNRRYQAQGTGHYTHVLDSCIPTYFGTNF